MAVWWILCLASCPAFPDPHTKGLSLGWKGISINSGPNSVRSFRERHPPHLEGHPLLWRDSCSVGMEGTGTVQGSGWKFLSCTNPCMGCRCCGQGGGMCSVPFANPPTCWGIVASFHPTSAPRCITALPAQLHPCPVSTAALARGLGSDLGCQCEPAVRGTDFPPAPVLAENPMLT